VRLQTGQWYNLQDDKLVQHGSILAVQSLAAAAVAAAAAATD